MRFFHVRAEGKARFQLCGRPLLPGIMLLRRRTWTLDEKHWVTDYGIDVFGWALWLHVAAKLHPDGCCAHGEVEHEGELTPECDGMMSGLPKLTPSMLDALETFLAERLYSMSEYDYKANPQLQKAYDWATKMHRMVDPGAYEESCPPTNTAAKSAGPCRK